MQVTVFPVRGGTRARTTDVFASRSQVRKPYTTDLSSNHHACRGPRPEPERSLGSGLRATGCRDPPSPPAPATPSNPRTDDTSRPAQARHRPVSALRPKEMHTTAVTAADDEANPGAPDSRSTPITQAVVWSVIMPAFTRAAITDDKAALFPLEPVTEVRSPRM
jgi:hypothetical protein